METNTIAQFSSHKVFVRQNGQTLIETVVAIFILVTGLVSGLTLAIYTFSATAQISNKIVATGLAREGTEIARRMRDSNWLVASARNGLVYCNDLGTSQPCYPTWLTERYDISGGAGNGLVYRAVFYPTATDNKWTLVPADAGSNFRLYYQPNGGYSHLSTAQLSSFFRKINIINALTEVPYSTASPLLLVRVTVWWHGKNCPPITYLNNPSDTTCKLIIEEYLTNWRNY